jgi:molybdopterin/thiamine biosynthesis adenylyltransferase
VSASSRRWRGGEPCKAHFHTISRAWPARHLSPTAPPAEQLTRLKLGRLADEAGLAGRLVEIAALRQHIIPDRYLRNMKTLSEADQIRLLESTVCIVGMGGLGGLVTETLARMGVGRFRLVDGDVFEAHNLNRQLFSGVDLIGMSKVEAAVARRENDQPRP